MKSELYNKVTVDGNIPPPLNVTHNPANLYCLIYGPNDNFCKKSLKLALNNSCSSEKYAEFIN